MQGKLLGGMETGEPQKPVKRTAWPWNETRSGTATRPLVSPRSGTGLLVCWLSTQHCTFTESRQLAPPSLGTPEGAEAVRLPWNQCPGSASVTQHQSHIRDGSSQTTASHQTCLDRLGERLSVAVLSQQHSQQQQEGQEISLPHCPGLQEEPVVETMKERSGMRAEPV